MPNVTSEEIGKYLMANVHKLAALMTDENAVYNRPGRYFFGGHHTTNHASKQYVRREGSTPINSNTAESFIALLKRGHYGIFHSLSKHHLHRYCEEFSFRWKHRKVSDGHRMVAVIDGAEADLAVRQPRDAVPEGCTGSLRRSGQGGRPRDPWRGGRDGQAAQEGAAGL